MKRNALKMGIIYLVVKILFLAGIAALLFTFAFGIWRNQDASMVPTVQEGDLLFYYRLNQKFLPSDVVLVEYQGKKQIRRVVATAGDTVDISEEGLMINGAVQQEPGIYSDTLAYTEGVSFPLTVGEGEVFLLGDNRKNAADSRIYGTVKVKDIRGKIMTILRRRHI